MTVCDVPGCQEHYGCRLRNKGIHLDPRATPSRRNTIPPARANPQWEKGVVYQERPGGTQMPVLAPGTLRPMGVKELADNRSGVESAIRRARQGADA